MVENYRISLYNDKSFRCPWQQEQEQKQKQQQQNYVIPQVINIEVRLLKIYVSEHYI